MGGAQQDRWEGHNRIGGRGTTGQVGGAQQDRWEGHNMTGGSGTT